MDKKRLNNKGLSLVEVVMSALLLTLVLAALFATYRNANNLISLSRSKLIALTWAQSLLEGQMADFHGAYTDPALPNWLSVEKAGTATVIPPAALGNTMQHLKVTINWTE
jgi:Tfp pilus assembly protein PilV